MKGRLPPGKLESVSDPRSKAELEAQQLRDRVKELEALLGRKPTSANWEPPLGELGTARVEREALLAEAESIAHLGSFFWDTETDQVRWSDELFRLLGFEPNEVEPSTELFSMRVHPADRAKIMRVNQMYSTGQHPPLEGGMLPRLEIRIMRENGAMRHAELSGRVAWSEGGKVRRVVGTLRDLTPSRETAGALQEATELLRMAQQVQGLVTWRWCLDEHDVSWSDGMFELFGVPPGYEMTLSTFVNFIHPQDRAHFRLSMIGKGTIESGEPRNFRIVRTDGSVRQVVSSFGSAHDDEQSGSSTIVGIILDVTDRHKLEQELRNAQKMEALGRLAGGVAHDFNNYLTVALGNAELLRSSLHDEESKTLVDEIVRASERCQTLTKRLLSFGRRQLIEPKTMDASTELRNLRSILRRLIGEKIKLVIESGQRPCPIRVDDTQFEQVIINLVVNARDAMPRGGTLIIRCHAEDRRGQSAQEQAANPDAPILSGVRIDVCDTGEGMDEDTQAQIFDPFFTTKAPGHGSGLGLSIVYGIVQQHKGRLTVQSSMGSGTTFSLWFPLDNGSNAAAEAEPKEKPTPNVSILLVEDNSQVRNTTQRMLESLHYRVYPTSGRDEALEVASDLSRPLDLMLADIMMPDFDGMQVATEVRKLRPTIALVFMSGYAEEQSIASAAPPGSKLLQKPLRVEALHRSIDAAIQQQKAANDSAGLAKTDRV